jgi:hypothetical protein
MCSAPAPAAWSFDRRAEADTDAKLHAEALISALCAHGLRRRSA